MVAILIVGAVLASITQVLALAASQRRSSMRRTIATREVGNLMEDLMSRPWDDLTPEHLADIPLSDSCRHHMPEAQLQIDVIDEDDPEAGLSSHFESRSVSNQTKERESMSTEQHERRYEDVDFGDDLPAFEPDT